MRTRVLAVVFLVICPLLAAQQALNNDAVIKLVKAGLSDDLIVSTVNASPGTYDTTAEGVIALKAAGASDKVVAAVVAKATAPTPPATPPSAPASVGTNGDAKATVHIYRYKQFEGSALKPSVYCDGIELGRIPSGHFLDVKIPAGSHTLFAEDKQAGAAVTLESGKDYFFRTDVQTGFWKGHFRLTTVMPEQGKYDVEKLKPLDSKDAVHELPTGSASR